MLSRPALANQLPEYIRFFSPDINLSALGTTELLDVLFQALLPYSRLDRIGIRVTEADEEGKVEYVRASLRNILVNPQWVSFSEEAFALLMLLARTYPYLSDRDPVTQEIVDPDAPLIFFSNGNAYLKSSVKKFYRQRPSYNEAGEYLDFDGFPLSMHEITSLQQQGVRFIEEPSIAEKIGKTIGKILGALIWIGLFVGAVVILPLPALFAAVITGILTTFITHPTLPTQVTKTMAFLTGTILAISVMALLSIVFPPVAALLVTAGLITSGAAAAAVTFFTTMLLPCVPLLVTTAISIGAMIKRIPIPDIVLASIRAPSQAIVAITEGAFGFLGRVINFIGKALCILPSLPPQPPVVAVAAEHLQEFLALDAEDYEIDQRNSNQNSTQVIFTQILAADREQQPEPAISQLPAAPTASSSAQQYVFPTTGSYRLDETEDQRTDRLSMTR
jgi:hypothetical protein